MSDYISKSALIEALNKEEKEFEDCVLMPTWYSALSVFHNQPTISETEIIRKPFERVVRQLNEQMPIKFNGFGKTLITVEDVIKILKEECGISE